MDTARVSWLVAPGSNPGQGHCGMLLRKTLTLDHTAFSHPMYQWVPGNLMLEVIFAMD